MKRGDELPAHRSRDAPIAAARQQSYCIAPVLGFGTAEFTIAPQAKMRYGSVILARSAPAFDTFAVSAGVLPADKKTPMNLKPWHWIVVAVAVLLILSLLSLVVGPSFLHRRGKQGAVALQEVHRVAAGPHCYREIHDTAGGGNAIRSFFLLVAYQDTAEVQLRSRGSHCEIGRRSARQG